MIQNRDLMVEYSMRGFHKIKDRIYRPNGLGNLGIPNFTYTQSISRYTRSLFPNLSLTLSLTGEP